MVKNSRLENRGFMMKPSLACLLICDYYYGLPYSDRPAYLQFLKENRNDDKKSRWHGPFLAYRKIMQDLEKRDSQRVGQG